LPQLAGFIVSENALFHNKFIDAEDWLKQLLPKISNGSNPMSADSSIVYLFRSLANAYTSNSSAIELKKPELIDIEKLCFVDENINFETIELALNWQIITA
jgi:hypothetical protein